jgi:hypothetical protein
MGNVLVLHHKLLKGTLREWCCYPNVKQLVHLDKVASQTFTIGN